MEWEQEAAGSSYRLRQARTWAHGDGASLGTFVFCRWEWRWQDGLNRHRCGHWDPRAHGWVWPQVSRETRATVLRLWGKALALALSTLTCRIEETVAQRTFLPQEISSPLPSVIIWYLSLARKTLQDLAPGSCPNASLYPSVHPSPAWRQTFGSMDTGPGPLLFAILPSS